MTLGKARPAVNTIAYNPPSPLEGKSPPTLLCIQMPRDEFQVTSTVLEWARRRAGMTVADLSAAFRNYAEWEKGQSGPTYAQLESLADKLKVPIAVFFFPHPPATPRIEETFRTLPDAVLDELPSRMRLVLRKAKAFQLNVSELCGGVNPAERLITRDLAFRGTEPVESMARRVRSYLGVSIETQQSWASSDDALKNWRTVLQDVGVFTFKDASQSPDYSGFCLTDPVFPIIYVNNTNAKNRQTFTLFHELAHLLFSTSGIDSFRELPTNSASSRKIEVTCNAFAAEFLLPAAEFQRARRGLPATEQTAVQLASRYHVSRESVFRRFLDTGEITSATYDGAVERWAQGREEGPPGGNYYNTKLAYLGRGYIGLALRAFHQNRITEAQLAQYLDVKPKNISAIEGKFLRGAVA